MLADKVEARKQLTDEELVEQIKNGNKESLDILVKAYLPKVYNRVRSLVPESDAEDVTQDVFISLVDSIGNFQGKSTFYTWFHRIIMNKIADHHRRTSRRREKLSETQSPSDVNPWEAMDDELMVKQILMKLPEKYREVLLLKFSEGLSFGEVAERLELTYEATRSRYRRAIETVRDRIDRDRR
jgi:RNA polymerase sigma-70 factor (ECF subfamily)